MATARFHVTGENMPWFQKRIQDEIHVHGLEGHAIITGGKTLAVITEGEKDRIKAFYNGLSKLKTKDVKFSRIDYGGLDGEETARAETLSPASLETLIRLLEKIEENTREMNRKLDEVLGKKSDTTISSEATSGFSSIFGND